MNKLLPLLAIGAGLFLLSRSAQGSEIVERILDGICKVESSCSPYWGYRFHPDGVSYGFYGLTRGAVTTVGIDWNRLTHLKGEAGRQLQREAARRYLLYLYNRLHNWDLAIQAYHGGIGNILRGKRYYSYLKKVKRYAGL